MSDVLKYFGGLLRLTLTDAQAGARAMMNGAIPREGVWTFFLLVIVLSGFMSLGTSLLVPLPDGQGPTFTPSGFLFAALVGGVVLAMALVAYLVGRMFGGTGELPDAILLMTWLQAVMIALQIVQTALMLIAPALGMLVMMVSLGLMFWLMTNFIAALHGFKSLLQVFIMIVLSTFGVAFGMALLLAFVGVFVQLGV